MRIYIEAFTIIIITSKQRFPLNKENKNGIKGSIAGRGGWEEMGHWCEKMYSSKGMGVGYYYILQ